MIKKSLIIEISLFKNLLLLLILKRLIQSRLRIKKKFDIYLIKTVINLINFDDFFKILFN